MAIAAILGCVKQQQQWQGVLHDGNDNRGRCQYNMVEDVGL